VRYLFVRKLLSARERENASNGNCDGIVVLEPIPVRRIVRRADALIYVLDSTLKIGYARGPPVLLRCFRSTHSAPTVARGG